MRLTQRVTPFSKESLHSDEIVKFYTGLPNIKVLKTVFELVNKTVHTNDTTRLSPFQEFVATVVKLRLNCPVQDLAHRLNTSCANCITNILIYGLFVKLYGRLCQKLLSLFWNKVAVIIDCFKFFIERPFNLLHGHHINTRTRWKFYLRSRLKEWYLLCLNPGVVVWVTSISLNTVAYSCCLGMLS